MRTRARLYATAVRLFSERGYEATTLRAIAKEAGVSPGLLYRYFPSKAAVVAEFYQALTGEFLSAAREVEATDWFSRSLCTMKLSLHTLRPHRAVLRAVLGTMLTDPDIGLLSEGGRTTRLQVQGAFLSAVVEASDAPSPALSAALGRLIDLAQLGAILFCLLDQSPEQRATDALLSWVSSMGGAVRAALWLPGAVGVVQTLDVLICDGFERA